MIPLTWGLEESVHQDRSRMAVYWGREKRKIGKLVFNEYKVSVLQD